MPNPLEALKKASSIVADPYAEWHTNHPILSALASLISPAIDPHTQVGPMDVGMAALPLVGGMRGMKALSEIPQAVREARAAEQGYTKLGWHGTRAPVDFEEFRSPVTTSIPLSPFGRGYEGDFGIHVATRPETAIRALPRGTSLEDIAPKSRILPVRFKSDNPLEMPDVGLWRDPERWGWSLTEVPLNYPLRLSPYTQRNTNNPELLQQILSDIDRSVDMRNNPDQFQRYLMDKFRGSGVDSIKYANRAEGIGEPSYLLLDPRQIKSVNAAFDPEKFGKSKNILAAGAPIAALKSYQDNK